MILISVDLPAPFSPNAAWKFARRGALEADILKSPNAPIVLGYPHHAQKGRISSVHSPPSR